MRLAVDSLGAVYITGRYYDSAMFGTVQLDDTSGNGDIFVVKYDGDGAPQWGRTAGGLYLDEGRAIAVDLRRDVRVAGSLTDVATFGSNHVRVGDALDMFVARIGPDPTITTGEIVVGPFCPGAKFNVPFTFGGIYTPGNIFSVQLSDSTGSFENALVIGRLSAREGSLVAATIPADIPPGSHYRIRVVSSEPAVTGSSNQRDITINPIPAPVITADGPLVFCNGSSVTLDAGAGFRSYRWSNGLTTRTIVVTQPGDYTVTVANTSGCEGTSFAVPVRVTSPEKPTVTRTGGTLQSSEAVAYRCSLDGTEIAGESGAAGPSSIRLPLRTSAAKAIATRTSATPRTQARCAPASAREIDSSLANIANGGSPSRTASPTRNAPPTSRDRPSTPVMPAIAVEPCAAWT